MIFYDLSDVISFHHLKHLSLMVNPIQAIPTSLTAPLDAPEMPDQGAPRGTSGDPLFGG